jgi:hypothetical protein
LRGLPILPAAVAGPAHTATGATAHIPLKLHHRFELGGQGHKFLVGRPQLLLEPIQHLQACLGWIQSPALAAAIPALLLPWRAGLLPRAAGSGLGHGWEGERAENQRRRD